MVILVRILFNHPVSVNLRKKEGKGGGHALISMFLSLPAMDEDNDEINRFGSWVLGSLTVLTILMTLSVGKKPKIRQWKAEECSIVSCMSCCNFVEMIFV